MKSWNDISNIGALPNDGPEQIRKIHLVNRIIFLAGATTLAFVPYLWFIDCPAHALTQFTTGIICALCFLLSRRRHFTAAIYVLYAAIMFNTFYASLEIQGSGVEYFLAPLSMISFTVFTDRRQTLGLAGLCMLMFFASWFIKPHYTPLYSVPFFYIQLTFALVMLAMFAVSMAIMIQLSTTGNRYENIIRKQKTVVEEKNKEITDSINYAKRIQDAKLPKIEELATELPQSFILFKPKDIVSGDFYYFRQQRDALLLAAADCTGHGVPGAFMSLIGMEKLAEAATLATAPSEILAHLNNGIKSSLNQTGGDESTRDGMDIALCSVDIKKKVVTYSGANRPLWIIRKNKPVEEIKATKTAIGGLTKADQVFERNEISLEEGDAFYIFSDGYADQFSGTTGKKLMTKKLKDILLSIQDKNMTEQKTHLDNFLEEWKAGSEQLDDILVIGIRV